eukprot:g2968.t1
MIYFHDRGDTAVECGREGSEFVRQAFADGFALICAEARGLSSYDGWRIGNYGVVHDENANPCSVHDSLEKPYMDQIFKVLRTKRLGDFHKVGDISLIQSTNPAFSMGQVFAAGYGRGAAFAAFVSFCYPSSISGFVQAGSGLKMKGDGVLLDSGAGECADCRYWPIKVLSATAVGRSFRHCAFSSLADTIAPATMSRAMCSAMRREGHFSTLYMSESGAAANVRPEKFLARAAHCMMIGGANAPPFPTVDPCGSSTPYSHEEGPPDFMNTEILSMSVNTISAGTQVVNADSGILPIAVTSEPCPPWNWLPGSSSSGSSHNCPCGCNGILPDACSESCAAVTIIRRIVGRYDGGKDVDEDQHAQLKGVQHLFPESSSQSQPLGSMSLDMKLSRITVNTSGQGSHFSACPPGVSPSIDNNYCMLSSITTSVPSEASNQVADVVRTIVKVKVTVGAKTLDNPQHPSYLSGLSGNGDPLCFYLDGVEGTAFVMQRGLTYQFFQSESDFLEYPFRFYSNVESTVGSEPYSGVDVTNFASSSTFYNEQDGIGDRNEDGILRRLVLEFRVDALSPRIASSAAVDMKHDKIAYFLTFGSSGGLRMGGRVSLWSSHEKIIRVTVAPKTLGNKYHPAVMPHASPLGYFFDGIEADSFQFIRGMSYIFDQTMSASNSGHPLRFYLTNDKYTLYANDEDVSLPFLLEKIAESLNIAVAYDFTDSSLQPNTTI